MADLRVHWKRSSKCEKTGRPLELTISLLTPMLTCRFAIPNHGILIAAHTKRTAQRNVIGQMRSYDAWNLSVTATKHLKINKIRMMENDRLGRAFEARPLLAVDGGDVKHLVRQSLFPAETYTAEGVT